MRVDCQSQKPKKQQTDNDEKSQGDANSTRFVVSDSIFVQNHEQALINRPPDRRAEHLARDAQGRAVKEARYTALLTE